MIALIFAFYAGVMAATVADAIVARLAGAAVFTTIMAIAFAIAAIIFRAYGS